MAEEHCRWTEEVTPKNVQPVNARRDTTEEDRKGTEALYFRERQLAGPKQEGISTG